MKHPKLNKQEDCAYPEREICNWDERPESKRCEYMKYDPAKHIWDSSRWKCTFKKEIDLL